MSNALPGRAVVILLSFSALVVTGCQRADGACTGTFEGEPVNWKIHGDSFLGIKSDGRVIGLGYDMGRSNHYYLDFELVPDREIGDGEPLVQDLAKDESLRVIDQTLVTHWSEQRLLEHEGNIPWPVEPTRTLTLRRLDGDGAAGEVLLQWDGADEVTCTFDVPKTTSSVPGEGGGSGLPGGCHGCAL